MAHRERYFVNGFMRRNSVSISPPNVPSSPIHREEEERKFNVNEIIAVLSSDESDEQEISGRIPLPIISNIEKTESNVLPSTSNIQPSIRTVNSDAPGPIVQGQRSINQEQQPNPNLPYDVLIKTVSVLAETVKSLKKNVENFENSSRNAKKKCKKRSRRNYSSDSTISDSGSSSSGSTERRRKKRHHRHKSSRSYRKRYIDSSSECSLEREQRRYHRHCCHCCKHQGNIAKLNQNQNQVTVPLNNTPIRIQNNTLQTKVSSDYQNRPSQHQNRSQSPQSLRNEPSSSQQNALQVIRRNTIRLARNERKIIESDNSDDNCPSENSFSPIKSTGKPNPRFRSATVLCKRNNSKAIVSYMHRNSVATSSKAIDSYKQRNSVPTAGVSTQDIFRPPNTNKCLYFASKNATICQICKKSNFRIVAHYKKAHENSEVYVSRISSKMVEKADIAYQYAKKFGQKIATMCYFCEEKKEFLPQYWFDHYRGHTGEYGYKCESCKTVTSYRSECCRRTATKIFDDDIHDNDFTAFICEICNFLQINEAAIRKHLRNEHDDAADSQYHEIILLPSLKRL